MHGSRQGKTKGKMVDAGFVRLHANPEGSSAMGELVLPGS
jgi:hypothetical protein